MLFVTTCFNVGACWMYLPSRLVNNGVVSFALYASKPARSGLWAGSRTPEVSAGGFTGVVFHE